MEFSGLGLNQDTLTQEVDDRIAFLENEITAISEVAVSGVNYDVADGILYAMIDTHGPKILSPGEVNKLQEMATDKAGIPVKLYIHMKAETVVTSGGHEPFSSVSRVGFGRQLPSIKEDVRKIIETSNM